MARKKDSDGKSSKKGKGKGKAAAAAAVAKPAARRRSVSVATSRARKGRASTLEAVRVPVADAGTKAKKKARKVLRTVKSRSLAFVPDVQPPAASGINALQDSVGDAFKTIGSQIAGALNSDVGRVMVAEMLMFVAKSLTKTAADTAAAETTKDVLLNAGAKIGAAAADAGARMVEAGHSVAETGAHLVEDGKAAAGSGAAIATEAAGNARDLVREVAQIAVGTVGEAVAGAAQRALSRGGRKPKAETHADEADATRPAAPEADAADRAPDASAKPPARGRRPARREQAEAAALAAAAPEAVVHEAAEPEAGAAAPASSDTAPLTDAEAGHRPPVI